MQGIYKITNLTNQKCYIGKSNNLERRWKDHQRLAFTFGHKEYNKTLYQAIRKYGLENFKFEVIDILDDYSISGEREIYWINYYNSYKDGYNETNGGDGGSSKGHCCGENNGRSKLTREDVIDIRKKYQQGCSKKECYSFYKHKISMSGFARVWNGQTWKDIMPEVLTEENKKRNDLLGKSMAARSRRILSTEQVKNIRERKSKGEKSKEIYQDYSCLISKSTFDDIWYERTYKEVKV